MPQKPLPAIETFGLTKRYSKSRRFALRDLDLTIDKGEVYGFLGPNGAGKTTTIRLLMNFIQPTFGNAQILGLDMVEDSAQLKASIGYLAGDVALYPKMTGHQFLAYLTGLQPPKRQRYVDGLARLFQAELGKKIGDLSRGNRQKLGLIQAFMHEPAILILDEPTAGLDPLMQEAFYELVRQTQARGATLFISSHNLTEVQKVCDRVGFIRSGRLVAEETINDLTRSAVQTYDISFAGRAPVAELKRLPKIKIIANTSHHVTVTIRGELRPLLGLLARHSVVSLERREINLEDEFLKYYKEAKS
ncbi:ABC transporter ATP-binding protein [Candidatus Saccharibacteria bacterium]|nr:ABC transporter ATP-binding protein [Candidatus Saccharibacteria bacterium]